jgi:hypothetical protein
MEALWMNIEWRPVVGMPEYSVSNTGQVRSECRVIMMKNGVRKTITEKILKQHKAGAGYLAVRMHSDGREYVHRLVAKAFWGTPGEGYEVNHIDENKENNCAENLQWVTRKENLDYGTRNQRSKEANQKRVRSVVATKDGKEVFEFVSLREAERAGFKRTCITKCCKGESVQHHGYAWKYK